MNLRSGTEVPRQDKFDEYFLGSCPFPFSLALDARGLEKKVLASCVMLAYFLLTLIISSSITISEVGSLDDVKGVLDRSEVQWMYLVSPLSGELLNVPTLR